ncbi:MAG: 3-deoxy-D-manno-octulosonate 8-phosphate phosphatase (KDO 8-P phosphatase) [Bacteroidia bacterium]|jgi:3-deoxy-D-manno-octulosonate 8-phosphate phosphatase (KDO 8-P phosphatase)
MADLNVLSKFKPIKAFVLDVDGVLTDGSVLATEAGEQLRTMNIKDGFAINQAVQRGYLIIAISGGSSEGVQKRLTKLGVQEIHLAVNNKVEVLNAVLSKHKITPAQCMGVGDDLPDYEMLKLVGLSCCPSDAAREILEMVNYVSSKNGGQGCIRELIEMVLRLNNDWPQLSGHESLVSK